MTPAINLLVVTACLAFGRPFLALGWATGYLAAEVWASLR